MNATQLNLDARPADPHIGFELGWDHAHHGVAPPPGHDHDASPVAQGWRAGQACFGARTLGASRLVRQWLQLRLHAWRRDLAFDLSQVTPHYLGQLDVPLCPVTRRPLAAAEASIDRVCDRAGYAAGNLAMLDRAANRAKGAVTWEEAQDRARHAQAAPDRLHDGLDAAAWSRVAVLVSFVTPLPLDRAARLPLRVQPPNRVRLLNPVQGLQALVTRELGRHDGTLRLRALTARLPSEPLRADFHRFVGALLPRLIEARQAADPFVLRHALEDAWADDRVNRRWQSFALQLDEPLIDSLLRQCVAIARTRTLLHERATATEGWALDTAGHALAPAEVESRWRAWQLVHGRPGRAKIGPTYSRIRDGHLPV